MDNARKLLARMRQSKSGWRFKDLDTLYKGFGFEAREGGKHAMYIHPKYHQLRATVSRQRSLPIGYVQHAIKLIDEVMKLEGGGQRNG